MVCCIRLKEGGGILLRSMVFLGEGGGDNEDVLKLIVVMDA